jgi:hypothetical protein
MYEGKKEYKIQEPKDSLHWISHNVKKIAEALEQLCSLLGQMQGLAPQKPNTQPPEQQGYQSRRANNQDLPF